MHVFGLEGCVSPGLMNTISICCKTVTPNRLFFFSCMLENNVSNFYPSLLLLTFWVGYTEFHSFHECREGWDYTRGKFSPSEWAQQGKSQPRTIPPHWLNSYVTGSRRRHALRSHPGPDPWVFDAIASGFKGACLFILATNWWLNIWAPQYQIKTGRTSQKHPVWMPPLGTVRQELKPILRHEPRWRLRTRINPYRWLWMCKQAENCRDDR